METALPARSLPALARFALLYTGISIAVEVFLLLLAGLRIPDDNLVIAPAVLVVAPLAASGLAGYRGRRLALAAFLTAAFTLAMSVTFGTFTGLLAPLLIRPIAAILAAMIVRR
jgi:hypothetical protein